MNNVTKINPCGNGLFTNYIFKAIPLAFDESMSYYEQLCALLDYIKNTILPALNNNADAIVEVQNLMTQLQSYVDNYFTNLDVQQEINNKLDEMAQDGTLAKIINQDIFNELNTKIENIDKYPFFDIAKNGGFTDGTTPNDVIFTNAKNSGYKKFYFAQNENLNANYYFTNTPDFNSCEILTDDNVILNFPNPSTIDKTKNAIFKSNFNLYSRQQNKSFLVSKNESDFYNQFATPTYNIKNMLRRTLTYKLKLFKYDYYGTGLYQDLTNDISNYFQSVNYEIRFKQNVEFYIIAADFDKSKNDCIEILALPNTPITFGCLDSNNKGFWANFEGHASGNYFEVNGVASSQVKNTNATKPNIFEHNMRNTHNNNSQFPMKYKLRNDPVNKNIQLFVNDVFVEAIPYCSDNPQYFGFGMNENAISNISVDNGMSEFFTFEQSNVPLNSNLKILVAGDSRLYGYNSQYKIDEILKNGLINSGVNKVDIKNISVSGYTMQQIFEAIKNEDLSQFDIVILATGINNYADSYSTILQNCYNIVQYVCNNNCYCIIPSTIPSAYGGSDLAANDRATQYYKIQTAIFNSIFYNNYFGLAKVLENNMGTTFLENNIEVCSDGVHPTTNGLLLFTKLIVNTILDLFN